MRTAPASGSSAVPPEEGASAGVTGASDPAGVEGVGGPLPEGDAALADGPSPDGAGVEGEPEGEGVIFGAGPSVPPFGGSESGRG